MPIKRDRGNEIPDELRRALVDYGNFILERIDKHTEVYKSKDPEHRQLAKCTRAEAELISGTFEARFREWMR